VQEGVNEVQYSGILVDCFTQLSPPSTANTNFAKVYCPFFPIHRQQKWKNEEFPGIYRSFSRRMLVCYIRVFIYILVHEDEDKFKMRACEQRTPVGQRRITTAATEHQKTMAVLR
jgi:hypothetical protein